jgi:hypothetical protein
VVFALTVTPVSPVTSAVPDSERAADRLDHRIVGGRDRHVVDAGDVGIADFGDNRIAVVRIEHRLAAGDDVDSDREGDGVAVLSGRHSGRDADRADDVVVLGIDGEVAAHRDRGSLVGAENGGLRIGRNLVVAERSGSAEGAFRSRNRRRPR